MPFWLYLAVPFVLCSEGHGVDRWEVALRCALADQVRQARDLPKPAQAVVQVVPEVHGELATGLLEAGKRISATAPVGAARAAADLAPLDVLADVRLDGVVV